MFDYMHPDRVKQEYAERLQVAANERRYRQFAANRPSLRMHLQLRLADRLIVLAQRLKATAPEGLA